MKDALDRAYGAAAEFAHDHPVFLTLLALGVLVALAPYVIELLGFGELGPIEGELDRTELNTSNADDSDAEIRDRNIRRSLAISLCRLRSKRRALHVLPTSGHGMASLR